MPRAKGKKYASVAEHFRTWLADNPKAPLKRQVEMFDAFCDSASLDEELKEIAKQEKQAA